MTMLYKSPGKEAIWGVSVDWLVVDESDVEATLAEGWNLTVHGAGDDAKARDEAALKANERELAEVNKKLALHAVHKGRGVWEVQDASGATIEGGLTKEEAQAKAGS